MKPEAPQVATSGIMDMQGQDPTELFLVRKFWRDTAGHGIRDLYCMYYISVSPRRPGVYQMVHIFALAQLLILLNQAIKARAKP